MVWLKVFHIGGLIVWSALLFYLPALFAAHLRPLTTAEFHRLRAVSRIAYLGLASPAAIVTMLSGTALVAVTRPDDSWLVIKLGAVALLLVFHVYCGKVLGELRDRPSRRSRRMLLGLMVVPGVLLPVIIVLALDQPA